MSFPPSDDQRPNPLERPAFTQNPIQPSPPQQPQYAPPLHPQQQPQQVVISTRRIPAIIEITGAVIFIAFLLWPVEISALGFSKSLGPAILAFFDVLAAHSEATDEISRALYGSLLSDIMWQFGYGVFFLLLGLVLGGILRARSKRWQ